MKPLTIIKYTTCLLLISFFQLSCKKYLDAKSDGKLTTPSTLQDLQAILDNTLLNSSPDLVNTCTDEYFIYETEWEPVDEVNKRGYVWDPQLNNEQDWMRLYKAIYYANTVLDQIEEIPSNTNQKKWNDIKGSALVFRAFHFFNVAQLYARQYDPQTASSDLGIPLRVTSDFNQVSVRSTIQETYDRIIKDLEEAASLLPNNAGYKTRPDKAAAYALLARVYLQMNDYANALDNSRKCLSINDTLLNYNELDASVLTPFKIFNAETIFYATSEGCLNIFDWVAKVDTTLYKSYSTNDLRKVLFFKDLGTGGMAFEGHYTENNYKLFSGIATDEVFLIKAECHARMNQIDEAMKTLNDLLITRWRSGTFSPFVANNAEDALGKILTERRKELINRGVRWSDIRRLNKDPKYATVLQRRFESGKVYTLPPNDLRYACLIPLTVINISGIQQNER